MEKPDPTIDYLPPTMYWCKRIIAAVLVLVALMPVLRWGVMQKQERDFARIEQQFHAAGESWDPENLNPKSPVPDSENAAFQYMAAAGLMRDGTESFRNSVFDSDETGRPDLRWWLALKTDEVYAPMFDAAAHAMTLNQTDWGIRYSATGKTPPFGHLGKMRALANELTDNAVFRHWQGDDATALLRAENVLHQADTMAKQRTLIHQMVATGFYSVALEAITEMSAGLRVDNPAIRARTLQLMRRLEQLETAIPERMRAAGLVDVAVSRSYYGEWQGNAWMTAPLFRHQLATYAEQSIETDRAWTLVEPAEKPNPRFSGWGRATADPLLGVKPGEHIVPILPPTIEQLFPNSDLSYQMRDLARSALARIRLARVALAIRLYRMDTGVWPDSTMELVPKYLESVPRSPWTPDAEKVEFLLAEKAHIDGSDRPMIYVDARSSTGAMPTLPSYSPWSGRRDGRRWCDVGVWPITAYPPSERSVSTPGYGNDYEMEPGFEASGLEPSEHSPAPYPQPEVTPGFPPNF